MATRPVITGAPTCATVIPFPLSQVDRARRELNLCHNARMLERFAERATRFRELSREDRITIGRHFMDRAAIIGGC